MIRIPHRLDGPRPRFVNDFLQIDATELLAKSRVSAITAIQGPISPSSACGSLLSRAETRLDGSCGRSRSR